jgi:hypothetical protein
MTRALVLLLALLPLAAATAGQPHRMLDRSTGATVVVSRDPWQLSLEQPQMAANARDYVALYAVEVNTAGTRHYHLAAFFWSTVPGRGTFEGAVPLLTLRVDDRVLHLKPLGKTPRDVGISKWPLDPPGRGARLAIYEVDTALLHQMATTHDCRVHVDSDPSLQADVWFEKWRDGRHAFADFVQHTLVAGAN